MIKKRKIEIDAEQLMSDKEFVDVTIKCDLSPKINKEILREAINLSNYVISLFNTKPITILDNGDYIDNDEDGNLKFTILFEHFNENVVEKITTLYDNSYKILDYMGETSLDEKDTILEDFWLWKEPPHGYKYVMGFDPFKGKTTDNDSTKIIDTESDTKSKPIENSDDEEDDIIKDEIFKNIMDVIEELNKIYFGKFE